MAGSADDALCRLDHVVPGAAPLAAAVAFVESRLGVTVPVGGKHPLMGTHNCLMRIDERVYLEIIAIDPAAPAPTRPRGYGLDDPAVQSRIAERPRLITWDVGRRGAVGDDRPGEPERAQPRRLLVRGLHSLGHRHIGRSAALRCPGRAEPYRLPGRLRRRSRRTATRTGRT